MLCGHEPSGWTWSGPRERPVTIEVAVVGLVAVVVGSVLKSISGIGLPIVTIPLISYVADLETAVAVTALPNLALNTGLAWRERSHLPGTRDLFRLGLSGFVGSVIGTVVLVSVSERPLILLLLLVVVIYAINYSVNPEFSISKDRSRRYSPAVGFVAGVLQGAISISAPILVPWIHGFRLDRGPHILSVTLLFAAAGLAQVPTLVLSDGMTGRWTIALVACVPAMATIPIGSRLRLSLSSSAFDRLIVITLVVSVVGLVARSYL